MHQMSLRCHREDCSRPWAHIYNGSFTVESVHGGHRHTNAISLDILLKLLKGSSHFTSEVELTTFLTAMQLPLIQPVQIAMPDMK